MADVHPLMLYNTLTRRKEQFVPLDAGNVRMYVCGPTVYDYAHIGNARPIIVFDVLFRLLRHIYGEKHVTYVRNITDVDDKINARAAEEGVPIRELTERTAKQFHDDIKALGVLEPTVEPRATDHIDEMRKLIDALVANGHAYVAEDHVLFNVPSMPDYGRLSNRSLDEMEAGARVEVAPYKKDPMDFVLWKPSKTVGGAVGGKQAEPSWPSPAGIKSEGRPGWHIECSAMAGKHLGDVFDIHGGGIDLVFPHHENEIAQSRCAHGTKLMARFWLHNGFLQVEGEKMSKSLGNFITIHDLLQDWRGYAWPGSVVKFAMLMTHYRQPLDFTQHSLEQAAIALRGFKAFGDPDPEASPSAEFLDALKDDLNTPRAIAELHRLLKVSRDGSSALAERMTRPGAMLSDSDYDAARQLAAGLSFLGIDIENYDQNWLQKQAQSVLNPESRLKADALVAARREARKAKDFKEADRIRDELAAMGIALKDSKDPATGEIVTTWEVSRSTEGAR
jgi:cysteinyl-tRNA synthetase